jgi:hypothetical protein
MPQAGPTRRRRFQFGLGTMLSLVAALSAASLTTAFIAYHVNWIRQRHALLSARVQPFTDRHVSKERLDLPAWDIGPSCEAPGLLSLFGERGVWSLRLHAIYDHTQSVAEYERIVSMDTKFYEVGGRQLLRVG